MSHVYYVDNVLNRKNARVERQLRAAESFGLYQALNSGWTLCRVGTLFPASGCWCWCHVVCIDNGGVGLLVDNFLSRFHITSFTIIAFYSNTMRYLIRAMEKLVVSYIYIESCLPILTLFKLRAVQYFR
jgi:hypothetical protein